MTGVKSPYILGKQQAQISSYAPEISELGIEVYR
jgi:hypothetical protein